MKKHQKIIIKWNNNNNGDNNQMKWIMKWIIIMKIMKIMK